MLTNIGVVYGTSRLLIGTMTGQSQTLGTIRSLWSVKIFQSKHDKVLRYKHHQDTISYYKIPAIVQDFLTRSVLYDSYPTPISFSLFIRLLPIIRNQIKVTSITMTNQEFLPVEHDESLHMLRTLRSNILVATL